MSRPTHLAYYQAQGISPVSQDIGDLAGHFTRRRGLYRTLGLMPSAFRGAQVLEVAPGSGHNSLFVASCQPACYTLVEPNPVAVAEITRQYDHLALPHTRPTILPCRIEEAGLTGPFDIVLCENWLGSDPAERAVLTRLGELVTPGGALVVTVVSPLGILANLLRLALGRRLAPATLPFEQRTDILLAAFGPHLATLANMTRPWRDWVQDNVLNPAYCGVCLTASMAVAALGPGFQPWLTSPQIVTDWRWYKALTAGTEGDAVLSAFHARMHNFIDHRRIDPDRDPAANLAVESLAWAVLHAVEQGHDEAPALTSLLDEAFDLAPAVRSALSEARDVLARPSLSVRDVADMGPFAALWGRESIYLSFTRSEL